ncbi:MAG: ribonuclease Z [Clostridia bacterium]|nr:ribonuclease Z [Clostridia bacterium]
MRLSFIGTSHGVPEPFRRCSCTMIETEGRYYFIDMGTQAIEDVIKRGISVNDVKGIFITHPHGDHCDGLLSYVDLINWYFKTADPTIVVPSQNVIDAMNGWFKGFGSVLREGIRFELTQPGVTYDDGVLKVTAIPTQHCPNSFAYLVEAEGKKVLFTGDLKHPTVDFPQVVYEEEIDLVIVESAHFSSDHTEKVLENAKVKRVLHNHISPAWDEDLARMAKHQHHYQYGKAFDGTEVVL